MLPALFQPPAPVNCFSLPRPPPLCFLAVQLAGLAVSVALLQLLEGSGVPDAIVPVWMVAHGTHVYLRYLALSALRFPYPNQARCCCGLHAPLLLCMHSWRAPVALRCLVPLLCCNTGCQLLCWQQSGVEASKGRGPHPVNALA